MIIGVTKELKPNENRVALTPVAVYAMTRRGNQVLVEKSSGLGSGITDEDFKEAGAIIVDDNKTVYQECDVMMKVSSPVPEEYEYFKENQVMFSFLYLASQPGLVKAMLDKNMIGIAYEDVELSDGTRPLLTPMSEIGGRMSIQVGAHYLEKANNGRGILLGGAPGVPPARVVVIGGGIVGENAARMAIGLGAHVTVIEKKIDRMRHLENLFGASVTTLMSYTYNVANAIKQADLLLVAISNFEDKNPVVVTEEMVKTMKKGAVIIDVDIDHGGSIETIDRASTLDDPIYVKHDVIHYAVPNMPSSVPCTSTFALSHATLPYLIEIASKGWNEAVKDNLSLAKGVNIAHGMITNKFVAKVYDREYIPLACVWNY